MIKCSNAHIRSSSMRETIRTFKALSDETRLRILNILLERECCVCEVMQALDVSQTRDEMNEYLTDLLQALTKALKGNKTLEQDRERLRKAVRVGASCAEKMRGERTAA
jgi:transposase